ncbi:MAG: hypothetical protein JXM79_24500 [Sedimentisphaerales bacterium]|nr:hypothetical protein [Sedimentisphaerales bacterium]
MTYRIRFQKDNNCVFLVYSGEVHIDEARLARKELREVLAAHLCNRILVDETRAEKKISVIDQHQFTTEYGSEFSSDVHIAVIVRQEQISEARFVENVAFNRGIHLKIFPNQKDAINWLSGFSSGKS